MTVEPIPIYQNQDFYVPAFEVKIGEESLDRETISDINQVSYKDDIEEIDSFDITINNWDAGYRTHDQSAFKYSDRRLFDPGKKVELHMGYFGRDDLRQMLTGEITSLRPSFPAGGAPTLVISGLNVLHRLRNRQESHSYTNMTDNEIARQVAGRLGLPIRTDDNAAGQQERYEYIFQDNKYDILFLMERARRIGYDLFVEEQEGGGSRLYFGPSVNVQQVTYELNYGTSLIEFQPELTTANQVGQVTVRGWDSVRGQPIEVTVNRSEIRTRGVGQAGGQEFIEQAFNQRQEVIADRPVNSEQEARTMAREILERNAKDLVKGSGSVVGLPSLRAGNVVHLTGLGERFSGRYFVTATTHSIGDSGYTTQFECRREELQE
jgi:phage protein D